ATRPCSGRCAPPSTASPRACATPADLTGRDGSRRPGGCATHPGRRPAPRARGGGQRHARGRRPVCRACRPGTRQPGLPGREWRIMAARHRLEERTGRRHGLLTTFAVVVGVVFLVVGILGFVPGVTTNLGELEWYGHESRAELFGIFQVSVLHN